VQALPAEQQALFYRDAQALANDSPLSEAEYDGAVQSALRETAADARRIETTVQAATYGLAIVLAIAGFLLAFRGCPGSSGRATGWRTGSGRCWCCPAWWRC
jgi:hypothetical protein